MGVTGATSAAGTDAAGALTGGVTRAVAAGAAEGGVIWEAGLVTTGAVATAAGVATAGAAADGVDAAAVAAGDVGRLEADGTVTDGEIGDVAGRVTGAVCCGVTAFAFAAAGGAAADPRTGTELATGAETGREAEAVVETVGGADGLEAAATDTTGPIKGDPSDTGAGVIEISNLSAASPGVELAGRRLATGADTVTGAVRVMAAVDLAGAATPERSVAVFEGNGITVSGAPGGGSTIGFEKALVLTGIIEARLTGSYFRRTILSRTRASGTGCVFAIASIPALAGTRLKSRN
ncbi:MAG TPA: hypothetical protein VFR18_27025 [Terriglobia bacterium]|nr:hypothetical protein [Terriglobia bacterium]